MKQIRSIYPGLIWLCIIWIISSIPSHSLPTVKILGFDKLAHIFVYSLLGVLLNPWLKTKNLKKPQLILIYCLLLLLAAADEYHQTYIPGRSVSGYDLMANAGGLCLGLFFYFKLP